VTSFIKDFLALVALGGFSVTVLTWMDLVSRLA